MMKTKVKTWIGLVLVIGSACSNVTSNQPQAVEKPSVSVFDYGVLSSGKKVEQYRLVANNIKLNVITYGGIITHLEVPDKNGVFADVVLGFDELSSYEHRNRFFGAIIGRYANRISHGKALIDGTEYQLSTNRKPHQIHGGYQGFDKVVWQAKSAVSANSASLILTYTSADQEEGYPGTLNAEVTYQIFNSGKLAVTFKANTDKATVFNPTQHSYFNLSGTGDTVLGHRLTLHAKQMVELDDDGIPTGQLLAVKNTALDFLTPKKIGQDINSQNKQIIIGKGYDHYFKAKHTRGELTEIAQLYEPVSGRKLTVSTTEMGVQLYSANYLDESVIGKNGVAYHAQQGVCLETGQMPNAPAEPAFKTLLVKPEQPFSSTTEFVFTQH
ncbi:aldose epimerase family protein [Paraglaciecola aquimarina]|uniref:Aldose 1-epimerase n=1 Tax=Paraglaciecola aquimarina TaxID=1235557 RepID=A0ABU3SVG0_9ALTE|nr:aldose epimerase family protein [Paraglaciecola aquimarina]MDU0354010.1 aldose epimerase family protein [Paraglaciecola aquimarina]